MQTYRLKGASGKVANSVFGLKKRTVIGSAQDCDLTIDEESIGPHHAEISLLDDGSLQLKHLDSAFETHVNGIPVEEISLGSGDEIRLGSCRWVLQAPGLRPEKVLTVDALKPIRNHVPWLMVIALLAAAALAWQRGWLPF